MDIRVIASGSSGNAYIISDGKTSLLLDAGIPLKKIQAGCDFQLSKINGCLITHCHQDHAKAGADLMRRGIDVYTSQGTIDECRLAGHRVHAVKSLREFTIGTFKVLPFDVHHDAPEPLGFLAESTDTGEKLLYFTDTCYVKYTFRGLTHIMAECNYDAAALKENVSKGLIAPALALRIMKSHMSIETLLSMLKANGINEVRQIYLLHLSNDNSDEKKFKELVQKLTGTEVYIA